MIKINSTLILSSFLFLFLCSCLCMGCISDTKDSLIIQNVQIIDGLGSPAYLGSVRLRGELIAELGDLKRKKNEPFIDGQGFFLSPGFIDTHSHHDGTTETQIEAAHSQGITTIVVGQDGSSNFPIGTYFDSLQMNPLSVNIASYAGHNSIRFEIMGQDYKRAASDSEIDQMVVLLKREMEAGALGLSTGLEYDLGIYSEEDEILRLTQSLKSYGGRYISHIRSEDRYFEEALEEIIKIGEITGVPVQISHMKLARKSLWNTVPRIIQKMEAARASGINITADVYPYEYWQSTMTVLFPERDFGNRESAEYALTELTTPRGMILTKFNADSTYVGKSIWEISQIRNQDPVSCYMDLIKMSQDIRGESVVAKSMHSNDIIELFKWDHTNVSSDGSATSGHPRGWGSFPRFINLMVKQEKELSLEKAIQKMTSLAADHMGIKKRGVLQKGNFADLVLFDLDELEDKATIKNPTLPSKGILRVWVNGKEIYKKSENMNLHPGKILRRE